MFQNDDVFDVKYVKGLVDSLSSTSKKQADTLVSLEKIAVETKTLLKNQAEIQQRSLEKIDENSVRIRNVERFHDSCKASVEIKGIKRQLNRLVAFKDMILNRADENSQVIDVHAERMKAAVEAAMGKEVPMKAAIIKSVPVILIVFVTGIALATLLAFQVFTGTKVVSAQGIEIKTNVSSHENK